MIETPLEVSGSADLADRLVAVVDDELRAPSQALVARASTADAIVAGFVATAVAGFALFCGYGLALEFGDSRDGTLGAWLVALTSNRATLITADALGSALLLHVGIGLVLALFYARIAEPRLSGAGWQRGAFFSLLPWTLSLLVFLPLLGGGVLGVGFGAGPLPIVGNLFANLVYGLTLGWLYDRARLELRDEDPESALANMGAERGMAIGVLVGAAVGGALAYAGAQLGLAGAHPSLGMAIFEGVALGATGGVLIGSYLGQTDGARPGRL
jgi:hypothetical protein